MRAALFTSLVGSAMVANRIALGQITPSFNDVPVAVVPTSSGSLALRMDIYKAPGAAATSPLLVWIHGGGWQGGSYNAGLPAVAQPLLQQGISVATIGYRLSQESIFEAQIWDVKGAIRHLRANAATYGINPNRIAAWGTSAGGHLTALMATSGGVPAAEGTIGGNENVSSRIMAAVDYFGPTDLLNMTLDITTPPGGQSHDPPSSPESKLIGFGGVGEGIGVLRANQTNPAVPFPEKMRLVTLANPIVHVTPDDPDFFIGHGLNDTTVPIAQSTRIFSALTSSGVPATFLQVAGAGHGALGTATDNAARAFVAERLLAIDGDTDLDGAVQLDDFTQLAAHFGQGGAWRHGDFTSDGSVNLDDFTLLAAGFGAGGVMSSRSEVPEPDAMLAIIVVSGTFCRRCRQGSATVLGHAGARIISK